MMRFLLPVLFLTLPLSFSCAGDKSSEKEPETTELQETIKSDTLSFSSGIRSLIQDSKGHYWIGSQGEGVAHYDGTQFYYFTTKEGLADNQVRSILEDKNGTIWFETANGISRYDGKSITTLTPVIDPIAQNQWEKSDEDLWFSAGIQEGVYRFDGQSLHYLAFPVTGINEPMNTYSITGIAHGKNGTIWLATYPGVFGYDGKTLTLLNSKSPELKNQMGSLHVRSILEDSKGRLWIGNNGIGVLLQEGDSLSNFSEKQGLVAPMSLRNGDKSPSGTLEHVFVIKEDHEGNIWFADRDAGAWKYDGTSMTNYPLPEQLKKAMIWGIIENQNKEILFVLSDGHVYILKGEKFERWI